LVSSSRRGVRARDRGARGGLLTRGYRDAGGDAAGDQAQLQRVVDTMVEFGMLPAKDISFKITQMTG